MKFATILCASVVTFGLASLTSSQRAAAQPALAAPADSPAEAGGRSFTDVFPIAPHLSVGGEILGGEKASSFGVRLHAGLDLALGGHGWRPSLGVGATLGEGALSVADLRALDGAVRIGIVDYGPEVQLGLRRVDGGLVDTRVYASFAYLATTLDDRLMLDAVDGVRGTRGLRATLGLSWADIQGQLAANSMSGSSHSGAEDLLLFLVPQQIEVGWLQSGGSDRFGVTFGWGF